jgi:Leucine-rich repeat (LRR) protein
VLIVVIASALGWFVQTVREGELQRQAVDSIEDAGGSVMYDYESDRIRLIRGAYLGWPSWLVRQLGFDCFYHVEEVSLDSSLANAGLAHLAHLRGLKKLNLVTSPINDDNLVDVTRLISLRSLDLSGTAVSDVGLARVAQLTNLEELRLSNTRITDSGLFGLRGLARLRVLDLSLTRVTDSGMDYLMGFKNLALLDVTSTAVTEFGAQAVRRSQRKAKVLYDPKIQAVK